MAIERSKDAACWFAYPQVERWARLNRGGEVPTVEDLEGEPFNFTEAFASHFLGWLERMGKIVDDEARD